ncbi:MAG: lysozyme inhibitor LprI family protein [Alphaproteobacteria bacterium]
MARISDVSFTRTCRRIVFSWIFAAGAFFLFVPIASAEVSSSSIPLSASFDCAKATSPLEKLICSNDQLAAKDKELAHQWAALLQAYSGSQKDSLIKGQRKWLKLRNDACFAQDGVNKSSTQTDCLINIYDARISMLAQQMEAHKLIPAVDFDQLLDAPASKQDAFGALYYAEGHNIDFSVSKEPKTCREFYAYYYGNWSYTGDTIGNIAETHALNKCAYATLSKIAGLLVQPGSKQELMVGLKDAVTQIRDEAGFHDVINQQFGDFTRQGKDEVVALVHSSDIGTLNFYSLYWGQYDPAKKSFALKLIDPESPYKISEKGDE